MSTTAAASASPSGKGGLLGGSDKAQTTQGISLQTFFVSLVGGLAVFGIELFLFLLIKGKFSRI